MQEQLEIKNKQLEIKHICKTLEWSYINFSGKYLIDTNDYDVEEYEIKKFNEKFKKQLSRKTTSIEILEKYIKFIKQTDEYNHLMELSPELLKIEKREGLIGDYQSILDEEQDEINKKVLKVAAAYALSIGSAWSFNIVPLCLEEYGKHFLVIWEGDVGHSHGSGTITPAMCEVFESHLGAMYVAPTESTHFETGLRYIDSVLAYHENKLKILGYNYDDDDPLCCPSLKYENTLQLSPCDKWEVISKTFIEKMDWSIEP